MAALNSLLVVQTWGIGDLLMTVPMIRGIRASNPDLRISAAVGSGGAAELLSAYALADDVVIMPVSRGLPALAKSLAALRKHRPFEAAIFGAEITPRLAVLVRAALGIRDVAGGSYRKIQIGFTRHFSIPVGMHRAAANIRIAAQLFHGIEASNYSLELSCPTIAQASDWLRNNSVGADLFIGIHPGSGQTQKSKRIPPLKLATLVESLLDRFSGVGIMIVLGPDDGDVALIAEDLRRRLKRVLLVQESSIVRCAAILSHHSLMIAGDTGIGHLASAVGVPVVTLAGPTVVHKTHPCAGPVQIVSRDRIEIADGYESSRDHLRDIPRISMEEVMVDTVVSAASAVVGSRKISRAMF